MEQDYKSPKNNLIIFITTGLAVLALIVLIISISRDSSEPEDVDDQKQTSQETPVDDEDENEDSEENQAEDEEEKDDEDEPVEPVTLTDGLPSNWHELNSAEKITLNPFDCPVDENNIVHLSSETGQCLEIDIDDDENDGDGIRVMDDDEDDSDGIRVDVPDDALIVGFGDAFAYADDSELTVTGMSCTNIEYLTLETSYKPERLLTIGQILDDHGADYAIYKADRTAWAQYHLELAPADPLYHSDSLPYLEHNYEYLQNFENWLSENSTSSSANLRDQLFKYLDCRFSVTLLNTGETRQFAHDCPVWEFEGNIDLIGENRDYSQNDRVRLEPEPADCTPAFLDFLIGEILESGFTPFIVNSDDRVLEVIVRGTENTFRVVIEQ